MIGIILAVTYTFLIVWYFSSGVNKLNDPKSVVSLREKEALDIFSELSDNNLREAVKRILGLVSVIFLLFGWLILSLIF